MHEGEGDLQNFKLWNLFLMKVIIINGQSSHEINSGIPKGFLLGLTLLLLFVNNLSKNILRSLVNISADHTMVYGQTSNYLDDPCLAADLSMGERLVYYSILAKQILLMFHH